ncbi:GNAT family N-acetyltransferase [Undibacterium sp. CY7W]|uniref:GNAT family N-acetyltransferase n=1 Tax=Undibacterium rugosum TaxID=2762291 RepID=A0A923I8V0_9BURK|nr:N-acetyltransferase [Undibacterium rugosum]MBC3934770.1 GNAT family N-acetyltransferase [Undibacterium rugosum]
MATTWTLRSAVPGDANRLAVLAAQVWTHTYCKQGINQDIAAYVLNSLTPAAFLVMLQQPQLRLTVAEQDGFLLAYALIDTESCASLSDAERAQPTYGVELATLYVQAHAAGQGIGSTLLHHAEQLAASQQARLWLKVNAQNDRAIRFYEQHAYQRLGDWYFELGEGRYLNYLMGQ